MDVLSEENLKIVTCAIWVPHGVAKEHPDKVEISKDDLERIIKESKGEVEDLQEDAAGETNDTDAGETNDTDEAKNDDAADMEVEEEESQEEGATSEPTPEVNSKKDDDLDFETKYDMKDYDEEEAEGDVNSLLQLGKMAIHASCDDDPYVTVKDNDDVDSEDENFQILPSDNLIAVGHVQGDAAVLEVYVYNAEQGCLYVHHDILLPSVPLCMEWLNYDACDEQLKPGNMIAVGSMSNVIEVWDLDLIDCLEPAYKLGKKGKKKKKIAGTGHKDAVLSLAWNTYAEHVLASGSVDETVILWDLQHCSVAQQLTSFNEKVQALKWHHTEPHTLLTGACDKKVRLFDCNDSDSFKSWDVDGEVECVLWDKHSSKPYNCLASTDQGTVYGIDCRQAKPLWTVQAHSDGCIGLQMSSQCPGCLITASGDKTVKVWDIADDNPKLVKELDPKIGVLQCLAPCPDLPFVVCLGGDYKSDNFKVWDIRQSKKVRMAFCDRVGLPKDEELESSDDETETAKPPVSNALGASSFLAERSGVVLLGDSMDSTPASSAKPKKLGKKKGGHKESKKRKK